MTNALSTVEPATPAWLTEVLRQLAILDTRPTQVQPGVGDAFYPPKRK